MFLGLLLVGLRGNVLPSSPCGLDSLKLFDRLVQRATRRRRIA